MQSGSHSGTDRVLVLMTTVQAKLGLVQVFKVQRGLEYLALGSQPWAVHGLFFAVVASCAAIRDSIPHCNDWTFGDLLTHP